MLEGLKLWTMLLYVTLPTGELHPIWAQEAWTELECGVVSAAVHRSVGQEPKPCRLMTFDEMVAEIFERTLPVCRPGDDA